MKLVSDFTDYYDHQFDLDGPEFRRITTEGPSRIEQFEMFDWMGLATPPHGRVGDVADFWWEEEKQWVRWLVVYNDLRAHCGEGKTLSHVGKFKWDGCLSRLQAKYDALEQFSSAYVGTNPLGMAGVSWRMLQIGTHRFWIEYSSLNDWRSNCGETDCEIFQVEKNTGVHPGMESVPLFAIDFALGKKTAYAIDLNIAPGIRGTGVEHYLSPKEVVKAIKDHAQTHPRKPSANPFQREERDG